MNFLLENVHNVFVHYITATEKKTKILTDTVKFSQLAIPRPTYHDGPTT